MSNSTNSTTNSTDDASDEEPSEDRDFALIKSLPLFTLMIITIILLKF